MKTPLLRNPDILSALMFIGVGGIGMYIARDYPFGSALRMGPGYFPTVLGGMLVVFGIYCLVKGLKVQDKVKRTWSVRALIVLPLAAWVYGLMMEHFGFIPALIVLSVMSAFASPEFKFVEQGILAIALTVLCVGLFIYGLGLPYPLFAGH
jgi:predicted MFS family arabinose efflux permease